MKIKQQKQIKAFLEKEFGKPKGNSLLEEQEKILGTLIENIKNKSKNQKKTLVQTILPGIALYKALVQKNIPEEEAYACMQKYMFGTVGENMHASMRKMELVPGFYTLYSHIFLKVMQNTDLQEMLIYGKEASNRKQEVDRQHHTIPKQKPNDRIVESLFPCIF